jgi:predicted lysophospholipase L1 biosynthesis ABC-type transport system permease subunit
MRNYRKVLAEYLRSIGQLEAHKLGATTKFTPEQQEQLRRELKRQYDRNQVFVWMSAALWIILYGVGLSFAMRYHDTLAHLSMTLGGNIMVLGSAMFALRQLWLDLSVIGALLSILPGLTPAEAAKVITTFYFNSNARK